jgi:Na+/melibiose symporter-like transporter
MAHLFVLLLEWIFFIGLAGSLVVAVMAFIGDIHEFFEKDRPEGVGSQAIGD